MKNKNILVTGGAGFIGSHITKRLVDLGANVSVIVKYKSVIDCVRLSSIWDSISVVEADLRNIDSLCQLKNQSFDVIFHLSAYNHVGDSFLHVNEALMSNAVATANILEILQDYGMFIYVSSSEVYGYQKPAPFKEDFLPMPISPYAIGKYAGELYSSMKRHQSSQPIVCVRPFNTFGPYQSDRAIIPELIIKCLRNMSIETTEGRQTREFNYVDNIIDALLLVAEVGPPLDKVINIGSNKEIAISELVKKIHEFTESKSDLRIGALPYRPTEIWNMCADNTRVEQVLGWKPRVSFDEGLRYTIDWYRKFIEVFFEPLSSLNRLCQ